MKLFIYIIFLFILLFRTDRAEAQRKFDNVYSGNLVQGQLIQYMADGTMVYAGEIFSSGYYHLAIGRIDANGNLLWSKKIENNSFKRMVDLKISPTDKIYLCGYTYTDPTNLYTCDIFLISLDSTGTILSSQKFGEDSVYDSPKRIIFDGESMVMLTEGADSVTNETYWGLLKIDSTDHVVWQKNYDNGSFFYSVYPAIGGGYIATTYYQPMLFRFDSLGNYIMNTGYILNFGFPSSAIRSIKPISDSMYLGVGYNGLLAYFDYNLNPVKYILYNGLQDIQDLFPTDHNTFILVSVDNFCDLGCNIRSTEIDTAGNILQAAILTKDRYLDTFRPFTFGYRNNLICMAADTGYYMNYPDQALELIQTDILLDSVCGQNTTSYSNTIITNSAVYNLDLHYSARVSHFSPFPVTITNYPISFIDCASTQLDIIETTKPVINIFPNPANEGFTLISDEEIKSIEIFDAMGKNIFSLNSINKHERIEINSSSFCPGIYLIKINSIHHQILKKLIRE